MVSPLDAKAKEVEPRLRAAKRAMFDGKEDDWKAGALAIDEAADLITAQAERIADLERALKRIDCLDEAGGHELKERHAFEAVNIARAALRAKEP